METVQSGGAFAEKLGLWLDFTDAIALYSAHSSAHSGPEQRTQSSSHVVEYEKLSAEYSRVREALAQSIRRSCSPETTTGRIKWPRPPAEVTIDLAADYEPYRRFYLAHQRDMETKVAALRVAVRKGMAGAPAPLQQLAALDARFDAILADRESRLLASVPSLLEKRFERLRAAHWQSLASTLTDKPAETQLPDDRNDWLLPGAWLANFCQDMQAVLLAELALRLQPTLGLLEAMAKDSKAVRNEVVKVSND